MNTRNLLPTNYLAPSPRPEASPALASAFAEVLLLEECVSACEAMAEAMNESGVRHALLDELSECIAACEGYLASKTRESSYASRYAALCSMICESTADACLVLDCETSRRCRKACRACRLMIKKQFSATLSN